MAEQNPLAPGASTNLPLMRKYAIPGDPVSNFLSSIFGGLFGGNDKKKPPLPPFYPNADANNPYEYDPSLLYPQEEGFNVSPAPPIGRINYGNNKVASRSAGQLKGAGRGVQDILPGLLNAIYRGMSVQAPNQMQNDLRVLQMLGPQFAEADAEMQARGRGNEVATDLALLQTGGRQLTDEVMHQQRMVDPEYYQQREQQADKARQLLEGIDPNNLTGAELTNAERSANRMNIGQGTANTGSNSAALKGALQFDDRLQKKRSMLSSVLSNLGQTLPNMKTNSFNYGASTGQIGRGAGQGNFASSQNNAQGVVSNIASNAFNQAGTLAQANAQIQHAEIPQWQQTLGAVYGGLNAIGSAAGGVAGAAACWVAEELFGVNDKRTHYARFWVKSNPNTWFNRLYIRYGKAWANFIKDKPKLKTLIQPIWEKMATKGYDLTMERIELSKTVLKFN